MKRYLVLLIVLAGCGSPAPAPVKPAASAPKFKRSDEHRLALMSSVIPARQLLEELDGPSLNKVAVKRSVDAVFEAVKRIPPTTTPEEEGDRKIAFIMAEQAMNLSTHVAIEAAIDESFKAKRDAFAKSIDLLNIASKPTE